MTIARGAPGRGEPRWSIVITHEGRPVTFMWREPTFAATWCEVADLDRDGSSEFLLVEAESIARVVSYSAGRFVFRPIDEVQTVGKLRLMELGDHRIGFVIATSSEDRKIKVWSRENGFVDGPR